MKLIPGEWRYIDDDGTFLPWYTSPCLEWLKTLDLKGKFIFEYGVGDSTHWYRDKGAHVHGVDSNEQWALKAGSLCSFVFAKNRGAYVGALRFKQAYDIVVVDGDYRDDCTEPALRALKPGGYLIVDNYKQESFECDWSKTDELIKDMHQVIFKEPTHPSGWATLVVHK